MRFIGSGFRLELRGICLFTRYATLIQLTKDHHWRRLFAALCHNEIYKT
jgi:hypothetical protein